MNDGKAIMKGETSIKNGGKTIMKGEVSIKNGELPCENRFNRCFGFCIDFL